MDEADRMLDMGFLPSMKQIVNELGMPPKSERQTLMFSATFPEEVQRLAREILNDYIFVTIGHIGGANVDIEQKVMNVDQMNKRDQLVRILNEQGLSAYCRRDASPPPYSQGGSPFKHEFGLTYWRKYSSLSMSVLDAFSYSICRSL